jgi:cyclopropane fatty-acyl-phospholipid synthase-like methyltransferase
MNFKSVLAFFFLTFASQSREPDVIFVGTPPDVVDAMLAGAEVKNTDIVYDLGSGDGRIVIAAARKYGARGVGIEIDPERIKEAEELARKAGVSDKVRFINADLFEADIREATVVTLYLLESLNVRLRPKLLRELKPGTRIASHRFRMGDWQPEKSMNVGERAVYFWTVPPGR